MTQPQHVLDELSDCFTKTAANIISYYEGDERKEKLEELREIVKTNCIRNKKLNEASDVKDRILAIYDTDNPENEIEDIVKEYKKEISKINENVSKAARLLQFERQLEALLHDKEGEEGDDDDDLQVRGGYVNVIDPISKRRIVDPVKNSNCGHTYDRDTITELLRINKNTRCPVVGCRALEYVTLANLKTDIVTQTYLEKHPE